MLTGRRCGGTARDVAAVEQDPALVRRLEAGEHPQQRGLAAAGRARAARKIRRRGCRATAGRPRRMRRNVLVTPSMRSSGMSAAAIGGSVGAESFQRYVVGHGFSRPSRRTLAADWLWLNRGPRRSHNIMSAASYCAAGRHGIVCRSANVDWFGQVGWKNHDQTIQAGSGSFRVFSLRAQAAPGRRARPSARRRKPPT